MLTCKDFLSELSDYLDATIDAGFLLEADREDLVAMATQAAAEAFT